MDPVKFGKQLAALRREAGLTQQALGEKLGVSNKTISRWENGNYMPDIALLPMISELFHVSINTLLEGQIDHASQQPKKTREIMQKIEESAFSIEEQKQFWKRRWLRAHTAVLILSAFAVLGFSFWAVFSRHTWAYAILPLVWLGIYLFFRNRMAGYVEKNVYCFRLPMDRL